MKEELITREVKLTSRNGEFAAFRKRRTPGNAEFNMSDRVRVVFLGGQEVEFGGYALYEEDAREFARMLISICDQPCTLPKVDQEYEKLEMKYTKTYKKSK